MNKRILCILVCAFVLLQLLPVVPAHAASISAGGWNETLWAEISGVTDSQITAVKYSGPVSGSLSGDDLKYLVRDADGCARIDIPGLKPGTYKLTVTTSSGTLTQSDIVVPAQDRSGYAHYQYTAGVGAYKDDGTLKPGTIVLYVTEENKNTVSVTSKDGTTVTGIGNILNSVGQEVSDGLNSKGGKANTNSDILRKLAADGTPLVVRIIGNVTAPEGLTAYNGVDYGGSKGDNGFMARMSGGKDITIEGIGTGAIINGWGLHFICQTADYAQGWGKSFEVRNISFCNVPEDCVGMEGQQESSTLTAPVERCWIHNCAFFGPTIANPAESDKDGGDGACDFKRGQYFTNSYCYYEGYHKTNLVGSSDSSLQYHMTYHHNYWKNCESRGPLARQANIHMYNNIFEGQKSYCMNPRANAYIFSEYNLFANCKNPVRVKLGAVKSFGDAFINCTGDNDATRVTDKATKVDTNCKYANFDTNASASYIPSGDYLLHADIEEMKLVVIDQAGPLGGSIHAQLPDSGTDSGGNSGGEGGGETGGNIDIPAGSYVHNFTEHGKESDFYTISGNLSTSKGTVTFGELTLTQCLKIETSTNISFTAPESGTLVLVFGGSTSAAGKTIKIDGTKQTIGSDHILTITVAAGSHTITKGDSINLFYMAYTSDSVQDDAHTHSYQTTVKAPTCTEAGSTTYTCACGDSYTEQIPAEGHELVATDNAPTCTEATVVVISCVKCGMTEQETLPATGHSYDEGVTQGNVTVYTCKTCGHTETYTNQPSVDPTQPTTPTNPTEPTQPSAPTQPTQPTTPAEPTQPNQPAPTDPALTEPAPTQPATAPTTGDTAQIVEKGNDLTWLIVLLLLVILASGTVIVVLLRKK